MEDAHTGEIQDEGETMQASACCADTLWSGGDRRP